MRLNSSQQQAVEYISGPCLVLAGAGSGKTRVITSKISWLIRQCGYQPRHIAAVTFTNKAAREMKSRLAQSLRREETRGLHISTFHTLGLEIIKREHQLLGMGARFSLFDDSDQLALLKDLAGQALAEDKTLLTQLQWQISAWKTALLTPEQVIQQAHSERELLFTRCYQHYCHHLTACNVVDFDDLILLPVILFQQNQTARERWQNRIRYLLVDEYQDTNSSQYQLVKLLVGERASFTVVGDDDQSIYSWRGAQPQNLVRLQQDFPSLQLIKLEQNYRSCGRILKAANILIDNNPHVFAKKLFSQLSYGEPLKVITARDEEHEAERVIGELLAHRFTQQIRYQDYAILYRGNHQARVFEKLLLQNRIPYRISGGESFFSRAEIKDLLAYLRLLTNPDDDSAFLRIVNIPRREIGAATLQKLGEWAKLRNNSLFNASLDLGLQQQLTQRAASALSNFCHWLHGIARQADSEPQTAVRNLIHDINYQSWLYETSANPKAAEMRMKNVDQLFQWMTEMLNGDGLNEAMSLSQVVARFTLRDMLERRDSNEGDQVQLMTLHAAKGLEFPHVFLVGMEEGLLPHQSSIDDNNIEEERRLAYVGITRAQQTLTFSLCKERRQRGTLVRPDISRFLQELPQDDLQWDNASNPRNEQERQQRSQSSIARIRAQLAKAKASE